jgi:hypothetical protein
MLIENISWKWKFVSVKVPFLSVGAESVGARTERCRGRSQLSGDYVVEDVQIGNQFFRQEGGILLMIKPLECINLFVKNKTIVGTADRA